LHNPSLQPIAVTCVHSVLSVFDLIPVLSVLWLHAKYLREYEYFTGVEMDSENYADTPYQYKIIILCVAVNTTNTAFLILGVCIL
jgi:hypothetical protein